MTKIKTSELTGPALDWAVAKCEGRVPKIEATVSYPNNRHYKVYVDVRYDSNGNECPVPYSPSTNWSQGGPIIDREDITWSMNMSPEHGDETRFCAFSYRAGSSKAQNGPTKLIAAMRCYCASRLGDEVDVPEELV